MSAKRYCPVHGIEMAPAESVSIYRVRYRRGARCPLCIAEARASVKSAQAIHRKYHASRGQPVLPPAPTVMMPRD